MEFWLRNFLLPIGIFVAVLLLASRLAQWLF